MEIASLQATCPEEGGWAVRPQPNHRCRKEGHQAHWERLAGPGANTHDQHRLGRHCCSIPQKSAPPTSTALKSDRSVYLVQGRKPIPTHLALDRMRRLHLTTHSPKAGFLKVPSARIPILSRSHYRLILKCCSPGGHRLSGSSEVNEVTEPGT